MLCKQFLYCIVWGLAFVTDLRFHRITKKNWKQQKVFECRMTKIWSKNNHIMNPKNFWEFSPMLLFAASPQPWFWTHTWVLCTHIPSHHTYQRIQHLSSDASLLYVMNWALTVHIKFSALTETRWFDHWKQNLGFPPWFPSHKY